MEYDTLLFDFDGVLAIPTDRSVFRTAIRGAFKSCGIETPAEEYVELCIDAGTTGRGSIEDICRKYNLNIEEFWKKREQYAIREQQAEIQNGRKYPYPDVSVLYSLTIPMGIITNNQRLTVEYFLNRQGLRDIFKIVYGSEPIADSIERRKPDEYHLRKAIEYFDCSNPLYVGDSKIDVIAAQNIETDVAFLNRDGTEINHGVNPTYEITSLQELPDLLKNNYCQ